MMTTFHHLAFIQTETVAPEMTTAGWIFMITVWVAILILITFTFSKVIRNRDRKGR
jgi:hypothetical protein